MHDPIYAGNSNITIVLNITHWIFRHKYSQNFMCVCISDGNAYILTQEIQYLGIFYDSYATQAIHNFLCLCSIAPFTRANPDYSKLD